MALKLNERYPGRMDNPSADYPQGSFKNRTTPTAKDGSYLEKDWANDKEGFFQSLLSEAGIAADGAVDKVGASQYYDAMKEIVRELLKDSSPVVGSTRNANMSIAAASASGTFTADELIVATVLGGQTYRLSNFNKTIDLAAIGAGGMDNGTAPVSGFVALYAIYNPTTLTSALLAVNATLAAAPEVYGGANMPPGYTASALVAVMATNASSQFRAGQFLIGRKVTLNPVSVLSSVLNTPTYTSLSIAEAVPINAKFASFTMQAGSTGSGLAVFQIASNSSGVGARQVSGQPVSQIGAPATDIALLTPQTVFRVNNVSAGTTSFQSFVTDYKF